MIVRVSELVARALFGAGQAVSADERVPVDVEHVVVGRDENARTVVAPQYLCGGEPAGPHVSVASDASKLVGDGFRRQDHDGTRRHDWTLTINVGSLTVDEAHDLSEHLLGVIVRRHEGCPVAAATGGPWPPSNRRNPLAAGQRDA